MAPARTGNESSSRMAVMKMAQVKSGILCIDIPGVLIFSMVTMKFMAPNIELIPAKCRLKMAKSTDPPE